ncbi:hypothetical protein F5Y13DRAFT_43217 [Hypoxylon sp. FL1857]|nr:hypothetical protein F5Y13DRAFT_43217 [Hypoxylon sp. FL1857]
MSGLGRKLDELCIRCGKAKIDWQAMVIAAARMKSYQNEHRRYFPDVLHVLDPDCLRENVPEMLYSLLRSMAMGTVNTSTHSLSLELVSQYRRFQATDPRDKVYALANMFALWPRMNIAPNYASSPEDVYTCFAKSLLENSDLEVLKHCGGSARQLPSWAPDWSISLDCLPLLSSKGRQLSNAPWWYEPEAVTDSRDDLRTFRYPAGSHSFGAPPNSDATKRARLKRLETGSKGDIKLVTNLDEFNQTIPSSKAFRNMPKDLLAAFVEATTNHRSVWAIGDEGPSDAGVPTEDIVRRTETVVSRETKSKLVTEHQPRSYRAADTSTAEIDIQGRACKPQDQD